MDDRREINRSARDGEIDDMGGCETVEIRMDQQPDCETRTVGKSSFTSWWNAMVGSLVLTLPYTFSQMGYVCGVASQFLCGAFGCWTVYLLGLFHPEASRRTRDIGIIHKRHILQYHEVIEIVSGKWLGRSVLFFNMAALTFACVNQLIACSRWNNFVH
ncbi:hypothetical protein EJ110_NYTH04431 [Nymphaea thermarum]|nr:hypothetical protein EJ110_NYTH04431 [Nymphaea thermarum]